MKYYQISFKINKKDIDFIIGKLYDLNIVNFSEEELEEDIILNTYLEEDIYNIDIILKEFETENINIKYKLVESDVLDVDWKKFYKVINIEGITIQPVWEDYKKKKEEILIKLDSGMIPIEGIHQTTRMCIKLVKKYMKEGFNVLDIGTGSGILGIISAKLGADKVKALEVDENLIFGAKENIIHNAIQDKMEINLCDCTKDSINFKADLVIVNILAEVIVSSLNNIKKCISDNTVLILSGISDDKIELIKESIKDFNIIEHISLNGWNSFVIKK